MFKSIFTRYFTVVATVLLVSFVALGGFLAFFCGRYWVADKKEQLTAQAQNVAEFIVHDAERSNDDPNKYTLADTVVRVLKPIASLNDSTVLLVDNQYTVLMTYESLSKSGEYSGKTLSTDVSNALYSGNFFEVGTLGNLYEKRAYTSGAAIVTSRGDRLGYVLVSASADTMTAYLGDVLQVFVLSALGTMILAFIALYSLTYHIVCPIRQMAEAAHRFAQGDFSVKIKVRGRDELAELAGELNDMAVSLSSLEEMRRSFVTNVSHELKTPMTTIAGFVDGILDGTIPEEKRTYYLKIVSDETKRLSRLVRAMLNLSRIDSGQLKLTPMTFDLTELACSTLISFEQRIDQKNLAVTDIGDCAHEQVTGDYDLLGQVIYNLLDNAIKFSGEGGTLSLKVFRRDNRVYCSVRNTGAGIPPEEMPHIFERFYKSDKSRSLDKNGVGLGLYIVKNVINLHRGEITVSSTENEYCEFSFWLPVG